MSRLLLSRREFFGITGVAVASAGAAGCAKTDGWSVQTAAATKHKSRVPVVVVGAGLGSLTAAAYLAKAGYPVTVVEKHCVPGGYATSFDRTAGRFTFDVSLHMVAVHGSSTEKILDELDLWKKVSLAKLPELCHIVTPNHDIVLPQADIEGCIRVFSEHFPLEEAGIRSFIQELVGVAEETDRITKSMSVVDKLFFPLRFPSLTRTNNITLAELLAKHVESPQLKSLLSAFWSYCGLPPSQLSGFYYAAAMGQFIRGGGYCYKPRSQALSRALGELIEECGGRLVFNQEVDQILLNQGRVSGVRLQGGEVLPARVVFSGASGPATFRKLLPADTVSQRYQSKLAGFRPSLSSFIVWLGLNRDIRSQLKNYETFMFSTYDHDAAYEAGLRGDARLADASVTLYDNAFDGYSTPGTNTLSIMFLCGYEPWKRFEADYFAGRKDEYNQEKNRIASALIERAERTVIPGLAKLIEVMEASTPLTNQRFTQNPQGAIYGYEQTLDNSSIKRVENRTPVKGLYLSGAWGFPGGGFGGAHASGRIAFQNFLEDWG